MIKAIEGIITKKDPTYLWLKTASGISYGVGISLFTSSKLEKGSKIELLITQIIREDANLLFGFLDRNEQEVFEMLLKVSGIGTATALAVCSGMNPDSIRSAVMSGNENAFKQIPGIGPKTAKLLIATLSDAKFGSNLAVNNYQSEAIAALESLGYKKEVIVKALNGCVATDTANLVKELLKKLYKG